MGNVWSPSCSVAITPVIDSIINWLCRCLSEVQCRTHLCEPLCCRCHTRIAILISQVLDTPVIELTSINVFVVKTSWESCASLASSAECQSNFLPIVLKISDKCWHTVAKCGVVPADAAISISFCVLPAISNYKVIITHLNKLIGNLLV